MSLNIILSSVELIQAYCPEYYNRVRHTAENFHIEAQPIILLWFLIQSYINPHGGSIVWLISFSIS